MAALNKVFASATEAVADIPDAASLAVGVDVDQVVSATSAHLTLSPNLTWRHA